MKNQDEECRGVLTEEGAAELEWRRSVSLVAVLGTINELVADDDE